MNTKDLSVRYKKSSEEIEEFLQSHIGELKNCIRYENEMWFIEPNEIYKLDKLIGYVEGKNNLPMSKKKMSHKKSGENVVPSSQDKLTLEEQLQNAEERVSKYKEELSELQDRFIELQNGQEAMNSSFIKKQQIRAEAAEHELHKFKEKTTEESKYKDEQIKILQDRIKEMQDKLVESHNQNNEKQEEINKLSRLIEEVKEDAASRCSKAELKVIESKRSEEKLYADLHETELKLQEMNRKVKIASDERTEAIRNMSAMKSEFIEVKSKLIAITAGLSDYLTEVETIPDSLIVNEEQSGTVNIEDVKLLQVQPMEDTLVKESARISSEKISTVRGLWKKVANFF